MDKLLKVVMKICPISPISLIDIGARGGMQRPWNQFHETQLCYYGFDADTEECKRLNSKNRPGKSVTYFPFAVSDKDSTETLYLTQEEGCSSFYKPNHSYIKKFYFSENWDIKKTIPLQTRTLKKIFDENNVKPEFLKIDTQGTELKILKGAGQYLDSVLGLEIEVEFVQWYEKQFLFHEVDAFVREKGFELYDLNRYWASRVNMKQHTAKRGQLIFADAIYFRSIESFYSLNYSSKKEKKEKLIKIIAILVLYGFFDVAIEYMHHPGVPFNETEIKTLENTINNLSAYPKWQILLLNNKFANVFGRILLHLGNLFLFKTKTLGWGTDYNAVNGRYLYHANGRVERYLKK